MASSSILAAVPKFQRGGFWLFVVAAAASAFLADHPISSQLTLNTNFLALSLWQPVTAAVVFPDGQLGGLLGTLALQWFVGGQLEAVWGTRRYLAVVVGSGVLGYAVAGALAWAVPAVLATPLGGTLPLDLAAVVAFGVVHGRRPLQLLGALPISGAGLAGLVTALLVLGPLIRGAWPAVIPLLTAALCALLVAWRWHGPASSGKVGPGSRRRKSHLRVVAPGSRPKLLN